MSIKNIVVSAKSTDGIDLDYIEIFLHKFTQRNSHFGSLNVKFDASSLCQLFSNGKIIVIGGTTEVESKRIFELYMKQFADLGHPVDYVDYRIQNIVACYKHTEPINLNELAKKHELHFNPEIFPAVRYRDNYRKITVNIFHTGNCVILGAKSLPIVDETVQILKDLLCLK